MNIRFAFVATTLLASSCSLPPPPPPPPEYKDSSRQGTPIYERLPPKPFRITVVPPVPPAPQAAPVSADPPPPNNAASATAPTPSVPTAAANVVVPPDQPLKIEIDKDKQHYECLTDANKNLSLAHATFIRTFGDSMYPVREQWNITSNPNGGFGFGIIRTIDNANIRIAGAYSSGTAKYDVNQQGIREADSQWFADAAKQILKVCTDGITQSSLPAEELRNRGVTVMPYTP